MLTLNPCSVATGAAHTFRPSRLLKKIVWPSGAQIGSLPPFLETGHPPLRISGKGRTHTSLEPDSRDSYAIHLPSGDTRALVPGSCSTLALFRSLISSPRICHPFSVCC